MDKNIKLFVEKLRDAKSVVVLAHKNPDGDALCSVLAAARLIEKNSNAKCVCVYDGNVPDYLDNVPLRNRAQYFPKISVKKSFDLAIVLDYGAEHQIGGPLDIIKNAKFIVEIDHHKNDNPIADLCINDETADATAIILYKIMCAAGWKNDADICDLLAVAILTDTGNFKFADNGESLSVMAELVDGGVNIHQLIEQMNNKPRKAVLVEAAAVAGAEFFYRNRLAVATIDRRAYRDMDGRGEMALNILGQIKGVEYIVLLKEQKETQIGISIRSRSVAIDKIAASFGGGGHERAAGAVVRGDTLENVRAKIIAAFKGM